MFRSGVIRGLCGVNVSAGVGVGGGSGDEREAGTGEDSRTRRFVSTAAASRSRKQVVYSTGGGIIDRSPAGRYLRVPDHGSDFSQAVISTGDREEGGGSM